MKRRTLWSFLLMWLALSLAAVGFGGLGGVGLPAQAAGIRAVEGGVVTYLPSLLRGCSDPGYVDDFSNPATGWPIVDDSLVKAQYEDDQYRIAPRAVNPDEPYYAFLAPTVARAEYSVEFDIYWAGDVGESTGGIVFGAAPDLSDFLVFGISPTTNAGNSELYQKFGVVYVSDTLSDPAVIVAPTTSTAIQTGNATNHLKVTVRQGQFTLAINGVGVGTFGTSLIPPASHSGIATTAGDFFNPQKSDAWIDNYSLVGCLP